MLIKSHKKDYLPRKPHPLFICISNDLQCYSAPSFTSSERWFGTFLKKSLQSYNVIMRRSNEEIMTCTITAGLQRSVRVCVCVHAFNNSCCDVSSGNGPRPQQLFSRVTPVSNGNSRLDLREDSFLYGGKSKKCERTKTTRKGHLTKICPTLVK